MVLSSHRKGEARGRGCRCAVPSRWTPRTLRARRVSMSTSSSTGVRHHYGFEASDEAFLSEWLYAFPQGATAGRCSNARATNFTSAGHWAGQNKTIAALVRPNSLYVSAAAHRTVTSSFPESLRISVRSVASVEWPSPGEAASSYFVEEEPDARVIEFLAKIGTGIIDYRRKEHQVPEEYRAFQREVAAVADRVLNAPVSFDGSTDDKEVAIEFGHRGHDGKPVFLSMDRGERGYASIAGRA